jgi:hypothetical protein
MFSPVTLQFMMYTTPSIKKDMTKGKTTPALGTGVVLAVAVTVVVACPHVNVASSARTDRHRVAPGLRNTRMTLGFMAH